MSIFIFGNGYPGLINGDQLDFNFGLVLPVQRSITLAQQVTIYPADMILNLNLSQSFTWPLPRAATRNGKPLIFVDVGQRFQTNPQTITPFGMETIVNWQTPSSMVLANNGAVVAIHPFNDGTNNGWFIA